MSGSSRGRKMLMDTVIIILNGTVTINVFVVFTRNCMSLVRFFPYCRETLVMFIVLAQPVMIAVDIVEGYYS